MDYCSLLSNLALASLFSRNPLEQPPFISLLGCRFVPICLVGFMRCHISLMKQAYRREHCDPRVCRLTRPCPPLDAFISKLSVHSFPTVILGLVTDNLSCLRSVCINHGSTVSLFHRLRSQTVSTKYLCVSGSGASFKGSDGASLPGLDPRHRSHAPSFVAKTAAWGELILLTVVDGQRSNLGNFILTFVGFLFD